MARYSDASRLVDVVGSHTDAWRLPIEPRSRDSLARYHDDHDDQLSREKRTISHGISSLTHRQPSRTLHLYRHVVVIRGAGEAADLDVAARVGRVARELLLREAAGLPLHLRGAAGSPCPRRVSSARWRRGASHHHQEVFEICVVVSLSRLDGSFRLLD